MFLHVITLNKNNRFRFYLYEITYLLFRVWSFFFATTCNTFFIGECERGGGAGGREGWMGMGVYGGYGELRQII